MTIDYIHTYIHVHLGCTATGYLYHSAYIVYACIKHYVTGASKRLTRQQMWWIIILSLATLVTLLVMKRAAASRGPYRLPPVRSGWLPWIGCALEFGKEPLNFIKRTQDEVLIYYKSYKTTLSTVQLGHVFTIHAAGKYMTFITSPAHYDHFFHTAHADFQKAVQPFTNKAG